MNTVRDKGFVEWPPGSEALDKTSEKPGKPRKVEKTFEKNVPREERVAKTQKMPESKQKLGESKQPKVQKVFQDTVAEEAPPLFSFNSADSILSTEDPHYKSLLAKLSQEPQGTFLLRKVRSLPDHTLLSVNVGSGEVVHMDLGSEFSKLSSLKRQANIDANCDLALQRANKERREIALADDYLNTMQLFDSSHRRIDINSTTSEKLPVTKWLHRWLKGRRGMLETMSQIAMSHTRSKDLVDKLMPKAAAHLAHALVTRALSVEKLLQANPNMSGELREELRIVEARNKARAKDFIEVVVNEAYNKPDKQQFLQDMKTAIDEDRLDVVSKWLEDGYF